MPGAFGPILTASVSLGAAAMVVANPVTAPHADVRIPAAQAQVSQAGQAVDMLDEDFIKAVGPRPTGSANPLAVLKEVVTALVADAADLGKDAVLHAFVAGAMIVSRPELTATVYPYLPVAPLPIALLPVAPPPTPDVPLGPAEPELPGPASAYLRPVVEQALTTIMSEPEVTTEARVVIAAFVAGAAAAVNQGPFLADLWSVVGQGLKPVLSSAVSAWHALPHAVVGDRMRTAVERHVPPMAAVVGVRGRDGWATPDADLLAAATPSVNVGGILDRDGGSGDRDAEPARQPLLRSSAAANSSLPQRNAQLGLRNAGLRKLAHPGPRDIAGGLAQHFNKVGAERPGS